MITLTGIVGTNITLQAVIDLVNSVPDSEPEININLSTDGGNPYEGFAIYDYLTEIVKKPKNINVIGKCFSAGMIILMAGDQRGSSSNSYFLLHEASLDNFGGLSKHFNSAGEQLAAINSSIINLVSERTGTPKEQLVKIMEEDKVMSLADAINLNIVNNQIFNVMTETEVKSRFDNFDTMLSKIMNAFKGSKPEPKNIMLNTVDGAELEFPDAPTEDEIAVGTAGTVNGTPAEGEYTMPDGKVYVFEGGLLTEIKEGTPEPDPEALKNENEALKEQIAQMAEAKKATEVELVSVQEQVKNFKSQVHEISNEFMKFKNEFSGAQTPGNVTPPVESVPTKGFSYKGRKNK